MGIVEQYLLQLNTQKQRFRRSVALLTVLSFLVVLTVSWNLRQTGITLANDANCGMEEHQHTEECQVEWVLICGHDAESPTEPLESIPTEPSTEPPVETPTEPPVETPTEAPTEPPVETPTETPTEPPVETPTEAPTEPPVEEPTEAPTEPPVETPTEAPSEPSAEEPTEAPTEPPVAAITEDPTEPPVEEPTEAPTEPPVEEPTEAPTEPPVEEPTEAPTEPPAEEPTEAPSEPPAEEPTEAPTEPPVAAITEDPTEPPAETPTEAPSEPPVEEPTEAPTEPPVETPTEAPTEPPVETPTEAPTDETVAQPDNSGEATENGSSGHVHTDQCYNEAGEHIHTDACYAIVTQCGFEEHIHEISCYADVTADLENWEIWRESIPELTGTITQDIVLVAQSQLGYTESTRNFELTDDGETRNGITRYGQWYGNPYGPWSNMFTSFCLRFAGISAAPINSGAERMMLDWEKKNLYRYAGSYEPEAGDIIFFDKNQNGTPESTGVIVNYFDSVLTVIEGDVDNTVVQTEYRIDDPIITGYGLTSISNRVAMFATGNTPITQDIGTTVNYATNLLNNNASFILYIKDGDAYYALDGNGNAVPVQVSNGKIQATVDNAASLYWTLTRAGNNRYTLRNESTDRYLSPSANGLLSDQRPSLTFTPSGGSGAMIRNNTYYLQFDGSKFGSSTSSSTIYFGSVPSQVTLWLDGTNGGIMMLRGSPNMTYAEYMKTPVYSGVAVQLPTEWDSPPKYAYRLAGWVNVKTGEYYKPGDMITVTENTLLYADWVAASYDIGQYNSAVVPTLSTSEFITTQLFDYSPVINLLSGQVTINTLTSTSHAETWTHVESGNATYAGQNTLDFSFNDHDSAGSLSNPSGLNEKNTYTGNHQTGNNGHEVYQKIYNGNLLNALFSVGNAVPGKHYLGEGDYLFQLNTDPTSEYYGYYYYDSSLNAASYNQSEQRFYVYDYLERASDSANNSSYSDFLPLNSPYANTNGRNPATYIYDGENGEYNGTTHYSYDSRYSASDATGSDANHVHTNWWYGMRTDIHFGLPDNPSQNGSANQDIYGNDMHFHFSGDDDVWVLIDGQVVLDLGGIHQEAEGDINFSTGTVTVANGAGEPIISDLSTYGIGAGEHTLTILYLERGASMGNCAIYFNLAPRFSLTLEKEDVLTQKLLEGAVFGIYTDEACNNPCSLWPSQAAYFEDMANDSTDNATYEFTITNGQAHIWGLSPSKTYYIKELVPPTMDGYPTEPAKGVIKVTLDMHGLNSTGATILPGPDGTISNGFTVHGFQIDEERQAVYLSITNAQNWVQTTTSVHVEKKWNDNQNHTYDSVTVYLQVTDPDTGEIRRIRQIDLCAENNWQYTWTNLPKYIQGADGQESEIKVNYSVAEAYKPGYAQKIEGSEVGDGAADAEPWAEAPQFANGGYYLLQTDNGYLSVSNNSLQFVKDEATAKSSNRSLWLATVSNNLVKLTNVETGLSLNFYNSGYNNRSFNVTQNPSISDPSSHNLKQEQYNDGVILSYELTITYPWGQATTTTYYLSFYNNSISATNSIGSALVIKPIQNTTMGYGSFEGYWYTVTNTPLTSETSVKVVKRWEHPSNDPSVYQDLEITVELYRDGVFYGTATISRWTDWAAVFGGLPYLDDQGNPYEYTIKEVLTGDDWIPHYSVTTIPHTNSPDTYEFTLTNHYRWVDAVELPSTGGTGLPLYILIGLILISAPFVYGFSLRRKYERRSRE